MPNTLKDLTRVVAESNLKLGVKVEKREIKLTQIISQEFKNANGDTRFNIYGLGTDGSLYRKIGNRGEGWVKMNMSVEYNETDRVEDSNNKD